MSSKEEILQSIRNNTRDRYDKPDLSSLEKNAMTFDDKISQFGESLKLVGGHLYVAGNDEDINDIVRKLYPEAKRIASVSDKVMVNGKEQTVSCATFHPDDVVESGELDGTDLAIINGHVGVCENGAVWIEQDVEQRAIYFISESLVILLDRNNLVNNMHEAYKLIDTGVYGYGVFISGPSKTADIEQALVMGAHGAHDVTVVLV